jgi:DNA-binding NtrC family response regulator
VVAPPPISTPAGSAVIVDNHFILPDEGLSLEDLEKNLVIQAIHKARYNKTKAAALLGLTRATLRYRIEKYQIEA